MYKDGFIVNCPNCGASWFTIEAGAIQVSCHNCKGNFYVKFNKDAMTVRRVNEGLAACKPKVQKNG